MLNMNTRYLLKLLKIRNRNLLPRIINSIKTARIKESMLFDIQITSLN